MGGWDIWILPVTADKGKIGQIKFRLMFRILTAHNQYYMLYQHSHLAGNMVHY